MEEKTEPGGGECSARREGGAWCEAYPVVSSGNLERGKRRLQVPGATSMAGGVARAAGASPCSFTHRSQSGPHPHRQCRTVPARTVDNVRPLSSSCVPGTGKANPRPRPLPLRSLAQSHPAATPHPYPGTGSCWLASTVPAVLAGPRECPVCQRPWLNSHPLGDEQRRIGRGLHCFWQPGTLEARTM